MKKFYLSLLTVICFFCIIGCKHPQTPGNPQKPSDSATTGQDTEEPNNHGSDGNEETGTGQDTEEPVKQEAEIRNENGTMVIKKAGTISEEIFQNFIKNGTLTVAGPLTKENYELIGRLPITKLDLSGVTDIPGGYTQIIPSSEGILHQNANVIPLFFYKNTALETVILPDTAEVLPAGAFSGCSNLKSFTGKGVKIVGYGAFSGTALETIELPAAEEIGYTAFSNCTKLQTLSLPKAKKLHNDILYHSYNSSYGLDTTIELPDMVEITPKKVPTSETEPTEPAPTEPKPSTFRGFTTENASLVLFGQPESEITNQKWQGHTWKSIAVK